MVHAHGELPSRPIVMRMATDTADALGITIPNRKRLRKMISKRVPIPQVYRNVEHILWIDRFYIAQQSLQDDQPVLYAYLSRAHIAEELAADLQARRRGCAGFLDAPTRAQFAAALQAMKGLPLDYATRELRATSGQQWPLDLKAPWRCGHPFDEKTAPASRQRRS